jgi:hypothetical protein
MQASDLLKINVNDKTEKKNGLTYLSWAWAWAEVLKVDPAANFKIEMYLDAAGNPVPFLQFNNSCMVWVTVTIFGKALTCQLPVLDFRNKCIPQPNAFDVNTSIMRCLVKATAMHGLGLYIYANEDLPIGDDAPTPPPEPAPAPAPAPVAKPVKAAEPDANADANSRLFADTMMQYTTLVKDAKGLTSYWKSNQTQLDLLKVSHADLYDQILKRFTELKQMYLEKKDD